ncbi:MAG: dimethylarginine dimethylaminohydrolase family protein [Candidatus Natronoplasma sp.]
MTKLFDKVLVRPPGESYGDCLSKNPLHDTIDLKKTLEQHKNYVKLLKKNGIKVEQLPPLGSYPDSIFIQDTALVGDSSNTAVVCRFGVSERRGEENSVEEYFVEEGYQVKRIEPPGTVEGGDILVTDKDKIFVGMSERTNESGIEQLSMYFPKTEFVEIPVSEVFHLLSGANFIGDGTLAVCPDIVDLDYFGDFDLIEIKKEEQNTSYENKPINMLYIGDGKILLPEVYQNTGHILEEAGYSVVKLDISEFWKGDAGMTCPMLPFYKYL